MPMSGARPEIQKIEQDYKRSVAIVDARPRLEQAAIFAWLLLDIALIVYFFFSVVLYLISGSFSEARSVGSIGVNAGAAHAPAAARLAQPLLVGEAKVLTRDAGSYDIYATVENVNADWYAEIDYHFVDNGAETAPVSTTVLPGEEQYLLSLNYESASRPTGAELVVEDVTWRRIDRHEVADAAEFLVEHSAFVLGESTYATDVAYENDTVGRSIISITNDTPYSYYEPTFVILLKRGGVIVAVNKAVVPRFEAGSTREVAVHWFGTIPTTGTVEAIPVIDYFNEDEYMDPEGELEEDRRDGTEE